MIQIAAVLLSSIVLAACGSEPRSDSDRGEASRNIAIGDDLPGSDLGGEPAPSLGHVHGLGVNPSDQSVMVATHFGLWKISGESDEPVRVGDNVHDLMGFSVIGPDHFTASGHPNGAPELPGNLGLVESKDAGESWKSVSLLGEADFHALRSTGSRTYGVNSADGVLMVSDDRQQWDASTARVQLVDFAVHPTKAARLIGAVAVSQTRLQTQRSSDGGKTWTAVAGSPQLLRFAWRDAGSLWGFDIRGAVWASTNQGTTWKRQGALPAAPEAVVDTGDGLLAAAGGAILRSADRGISWQEVHRYEP